MLSDFETHEASRRLAHSVPRRSKESSLDSLVSFEVLREEVAVLASSFAAAAKLAVAALDELARLAAPADVFSLSGGSARSQSMGMARGIGFVLLKPSVAGLAEARLSLFADNSALLEFQRSDESLSLVLLAKAFLCVRLAPVLKLLLLVL